MKTYYQLVESITEMKITLTEIMRKENLSISNLAERIEIAPATLKRFLSNEVVAHSKTLAMIDDFLIRYEEQKNKGIGMEF